MERREATRMNTGAQPAALQRGGSGGCASWSGGHSWPPSLRGSWLCRWHHEFSMDGARYTYDGTRKTTTIGPLSCKTAWHTADSQWAEHNYIVLN